VIPYVRLSDALEVEEAAEKVLREQLDRFGPALVRPSPKWLDEDYLIIDVESAQQRDGHSASLMQEMPGSALGRHRPKEVRTIFGPSSVQLKRLVAPRVSA
jgi:hypothetical protein